MWPQLGNLDMVADGGGAECTGAIAFAFGTELGRGVWFGYVEVVVGGGGGGSGVRCCPQRGLHTELWSVKI